MDVVANFQLKIILLEINMRYTVYIYLDREQAKEGIALVLGASELYWLLWRTRNWDNIPYYITYVPELDTAREVTNEEMLERNQRELKENEILIDGKIVDYDINSQKIVNNEIVDKTREDYINEKVITLDTEKLNAVDLYDKAVLRGDIVETPKEERDIFRNAWLEIPNNYTDLSIPIEQFYPLIPEKIKYFI